MPSVSPSEATLPESSATTPPANGFRAPWLLFWVAFLVRVLYVLLARTYHFRPYDDHFTFGWEMGRIARALATGYGYSDPFRGHTGPTAWTAPLYPLVLAAIFKVFGVYTNASALAAVILNCAFSAIAARNTWEIAARCFNLRVAQWSGWLWALYPAAMQFAVRWLWEMNLSLFLFTTILVLALRLRGIGEQEVRGNKEATQETTDDRLGLWALFGALWGLLALSNPALVILLPACGLWVLIGLIRTRPGTWGRPMRGALLAGVICLLCIAPWIARNWLVFHHFVPIRGNFGVELCLGDGPGADGLLMDYNHPVRAPEQLRLYRMMGETAYSKYRGQIAMDFMRKDPGLLLRNTLLRTYYFWAGTPAPIDHGWFTEAARELNFAFVSVAGLLGLVLAVRRRVPAMGLFVCVFLFYPLTYYLVMAYPRFRHPLEPLITILAVYLFQSAIPRGMNSRRIGRRHVDQSAGAR